MNGFSDDEDSCELPDDEVMEIKRAMRVAKARKQSLSMQMKQKIDRNSADRNELESIIRKQSAELSRTQTMLAQTDFDLKEARFEINRVHEREAKLKEEKQIIDTKSKDVIAELKNQLQQKHISSEERNQVAIFECDKLIKTLSSLYKSVFDGRGSNTVAPKTTKQLLDKAALDAENLKEFLQTKSVAALTGEQDRVTVVHARLNAANVESCDNALLDMCRSLEEENRALTEATETLKAQLAEASRDASINRLIPHYRLAIVRSRTYAANLLEQVKREQATSQTLREQLDATYVDLKKVVEEKRRLFTRMSKYSLQLEEKDSFLAHQRAVDEQRILDASRTLASSPLRHSGSDAKRTETAPTTVDGPVHRASVESSNHSDYYEQRSEHVANHRVEPEQRPEHRASEHRASDARPSLPESGYLSVPYSAPPTVPRPRSPYLRELAATTSARTSSDTVASAPLSAASHLKEELSQLDGEIEQLKEKLGKAAAIRSQRILNEVFDAHAPAYHQ